MPGHAGIEGNELADAKARYAAGIPTSTSPLAPQTRHDLLTQQVIKTPPCSSLARATHWANMQLAQDFFSLAKATASIPALF